MTWTPNIPGTTIPRIELLGWLCQAHVDMVTAPNPAAGRKTLPVVASYGVLSVHQLSLVYSYARQYMYEKLRELAIPIPDKDYQGWVDPRGFEKMKLLVMACQLHRPIPESVLDVMPKCGRRGIVRYLTGYDYMTKELS